MDFVEVRGQCRAVSIPDSRSHVYTVCLVTPATLAISLMVSVPCAPITAALSRRSALCLPVAACLIAVRGFIARRPEAVNRRTSTGAARRL
jgi:hypothetical protein